MPDEAGFTIADWTDPVLPASLGVLAAEAVAAGYTWMGGFATSWAERPFLERGEGLFLAMEGDRVLAMAVISRDPYVADQRTGRLRFIYVIESARRRGIAEALVRACLERGAGHWPVITLHTDNPKAAALYARYGFEEIAGGVRSTHQRVGDAK
jgi:ribosomal protein S18 acetylase RimI-like enzyme